MNRRRRFAVLWSVIVVAGLLFSGCTDKTIPPSKTLVVGTPTHNGLYNHLYAATTYDEDVCNLIYESLVEDAPDGIDKANERLVESLVISPDGLDYTFTLRKGITFSDKSPLTAEDVVFTYQTLADPSSTATKRQWMDDFLGGAEYRAGTSQDFGAVELVDQQTVIFHFRQKSRTNLGRCGLKILSSAYYSDWEQGNVDFVMHEKMSLPLGSGPYQLTEYLPNEQVVLAKNPNYWAKGSTDYQIQQIEIKFIPNSQRVQALQEGLVDVVPQITDQGSFDQLTQWQSGLETPTVNMVSYQRNSYGFFGFNTADPLSGDVVLRQAVAFGFDRQGFVNSYFGKQGLRVDAPIPSSSDLYPLIADSLNHYEYSPEMAKALLISNGYQYDTQGLLLSPEGEPVVLTFLATYDNQTLKAMLPSFEENMRAVGILLNVEEISFGELVSNLQEGREDWNLFFMADDWHGDDPNEWSLYFSTKGIPLTNVTHYSNSQVDALLELGLEQTDAYSVETLATYKEVLLTLNNDLPELPIYTGSATAIMNVGVQDLKVGTYQRWSEGIEGATLNK